MRFSIGRKVKVIHCYSGAEFYDGEIVTIVGIGCEYEPDCYECKGENSLCNWYLYEDEVSPITNGDKIRGMTDAELADFLRSYRCGRCRKYGNDCFPIENIEEWLGEYSN